MDKPDVIAYFRHFFAEERLLRISNFHVLADDVLDVRTFYMKLTMVSRIEHLIRNDNVVVPRLPKHCFDLMTVSEVILGFARGRGLVGMCLWMQSIILINVDHIGVIFNQ